MNIDALTLEDIQNMETIHSGHFDDLKFEDIHKGIRVWLSRVEKNLAEIETVVPGEGWRVTRTIRE